MIWPVLVMVGSGHCVRDAVAVERLGDAECVGVSLRWRVPVVVGPQGADIEAEVPRVPVPERLREAGGVDVGDQGVVGVRVSAPDRVPVPVWVRVGAAVGVAVREGVRSPEAVRLCAAVAVGVRLRLQLRLRSGRGVAVAVADPVPEEEGLWVDVAAALQERVGVAVQVGARVAEREWERLAVGDAGSLADALPDALAVREPELNEGDGAAVHEVVAVNERETLPRAVGGLAVPVREGLAVVRVRVGGLAVSVPRRLGTAVGVRVRLPVGVQLAETVRAALQLVDALLTAVADTDTVPVPDAAELGVRDCDFEGCPLGLRLRDGVGVRERERENGAVADTEAVTEAAVAVQVHVGARECEGVRDAA